MKQLIVIIGPNAVGKSTTAKKIVEQHSKCAFVDSDWCRVMNPFVLTNTTQKLVIDNIYCLLYNYLTCKDINTVIFTHSWHGGRREIYDCIIGKLKKEKVIFKENIIILKCSYIENERRALIDERDINRIERGLENTFLFYDEFNFPVFDTTRMTIQEVAEQIWDFVNKKNDL